MTQREILLDLPGSPPDLRLQLAPTTRAIFLPRFVRGLPGITPIPVGDSGERTADGVEVWRPVSWLKVGR